jgi:hypothetical protein
LLESFLDDAKKEDEADCKVPIEISLSSRCTLSSAIEISTNYKILGSPRNCGVEIGLEMLMNEL